MYDDSEWAHEMSDEPTELEDSYPYAERLRSSGFVFRLRNLQDALYWHLRKTMNPELEGPVVVSAIDSLYRAERLARAMIPFDPTGL